MQTMNLSLPEPMKQYVEEQVNAGGYSELLRADQKRRAKDRLENTLLESLQSGDAVEITPQMWEELRQNLRARAKSRKR